jgi:hyaluronate lyase
LVVMNVNRVICLFLAAVLLISSLFFTLPKVVHADEYDSMLLKWRDTLTGGNTFNTLDSDIATRTSSIVTEAQTYWTNMNKNVGRTYLWSDLNSTTDPADITASYKRLKIMTQAAVIQGSSLLNHTTLTSDIIAGLDWLNANRYSTSIPKYGNWWDWNIGVPLLLNDIVVMLYANLTSTQTTNYMNAVNYYTPASLISSYTGANRVWISTVVGVRAVIVKSSTNLAAARRFNSSFFLC